MTNPPLQKRNSFLKAMVLTVIVVIPIVIVSAVGGKDPSAAGEFAGWLSTGPILGGIAVGIWAKLDKHQWKWLDYTWRFAVCSVALFFVSTLGDVGRSGSRVVDVTESEKQHLVVSGTNVHHTDFGFSLALPSAGYHVNTQLQDQANQSFVERGAASNYMWVLQDSSRTGVIMLLVSKGPGESKDALRAAGRGLQRGTAKNGGRIFEDTMRWNSETRDYRFAAAFPQGAYIKARCLPARAFIVCVETVSADSNALAGVRDRITLASWR